MLAKLILGNSRFLFLKPRLVDALPQRVQFLLRQSCAPAQFLAIRPQLFKRIARNRQSLLTLFTRRQPFLKQAVQLRFVKITLFGLQFFQMSLELNSIFVNIA